MNKGVFIHAIAEARFEKAVKLSLKLRRQAVLSVPVNAPK